MGVYVLKGRLIDSVSNEPQENSMVIIKNELIEYVGSALGYCIPENAEIIEVENGTIMPGFIDCHAHLCGDESLRGSHLETILKAAHDAGILLDAGFTSIRDMSLFGPYLGKSIDKGITRGPRIMPGGRVMSITSGHCDFDPDFPVEYTNRYSPINYLVDGVDGCIKGVREQFRIGAKFIKICATGGVSSSTDGIDDVQFSFEEIKAVVEEAKRHGTYTAAHCTGAAGAYQALKAGVTSIEHGVFLDEKCIEIMKELDATLVTTLSIATDIAVTPGILPEYAYKKALKCADANLRSVAMARKAGIRIALGTDYSNSKTTQYSQNGKEFTAIVNAGFTPMEAITIGTRNAAHLMRMKDKIGTIERGKLADIVIVEGNPIEDITLLGNKENVKVVMKNGIIEKNITCNKTKES